MKTPIKTWTLKQFLAEPFPSPIAIVENTLNANEMVILSARAKAGKSLLVTNLAIAVASGSPFIGRPVRSPGRVLMWQIEVENIALRERFEKMLQVFENRDWFENLFIVSERIRIDQPEGLQVLSSKLSEINPTLLILDPFYTLHRSDEDKSSAIGPILSNLREVVKSKGVALVLVHHQGKRGEQDNRQTGHQHRGSSSFADVPDSNWSLDRKNQNPVAKISFESRNHAPAEGISLLLGENLWWKPTESDVIDKVKPSCRDVAIVVADQEGLNKTQLTEVVMVRFNIGERNAEKLISDALDLRIVRKEVQGKFAHYYLPYKPHPHDRIPLEDCGPADVKIEPGFDAGSPCLTRW